MIPADVQGTEEAAAQFWAAEGILQGAVLTDRVLCFMLKWNYGFLSWNMTIQGRSPRIFRVEK